MTQHAKWTARQIRRALFGESLVDFSGSNWSSIKLHKSDPVCQPVNRSKKTVSRMMQEFSQAGIDGASHLSDEDESQDVDMDVGTAPDGLSLSTTAVHYQMFSPSDDELEGSICTS